MQPTKSFRDGTITVSFWGDEKNLSKSAKVSFQKRYCDSQGQWQSSSSLYLSEIPRAISLLQEAYDYLQHGREEHKTA